MTKVYACILGKWECLTDDAGCTIDNNGQSELAWWNECAQDMFKYDYVNICFEHKEYRIHPSFIQIVKD